MAVTKTVNGGVITYLSATATEVAQAISDEKRTETQVLSIVYDSTNGEFVAFVKIN